MRRLVVAEWVTLDGVAQAPVSPAEDPDGGFAHGGWHLPHAADPAAQQWTVEAIAAATGGYLLGRRTYAALGAYWPHAGEAERAVAEPLNTRPKYVATRAPDAPLAWGPATALAVGADAGDAGPAGSGLAAAVAALKAEPGGDLLVMGSARLAAALFAHDLVDELRLTIDPVLVGGGKRPFAANGARTALRLVAHRVTGTGAVLAHYARA